MNRLRERRELVPLARWRLAAAYWYSGQRDAARNLAAGQSTAVAEYREYGGTFGSAFRDKAVILETLILLGNSEADTKALFEEMAATLASETWLSTQETAAALRSAMAFMQGAAAGQVREMNVNFSFAGSRNSAAFSSQVMQSPLGSPSGASGNFSVTNNSAAPLYARVSVRGLPEEGREQALSRGLSLAVEYRSASGAYVDPGAASPGQDITVEATVSNTRQVAVENIALVHQFPASWEILNDRLGAEGGAAGNVDYQDIRDDRVMSYFSLDPGAAKTVSVRVNKTYAGTYFRPAVHAYAMYDESVAAVVPGVRRQ